MEGVRQIRIAITVVIAESAPPRKDHNCCCREEQVEGAVETTAVLVLALGVALAAVNAAQQPAHTLEARQEAVTKPIVISQQLTDETTENKLDLHVWKVTMSL